MQNVRRGLRGEPLVFWNQAYRDSGMTELTKTNERFQDLDNAEREARLEG